MNLNPPTEHQLLIFWVALLVLLVVARLLGALAQRFGQPAVIGELGAGLLLGPSLLGRVAPDVSDWLFPADDVQTGMLFTVGWLGVVFLLISTGYETDLGLIRRLGVAAVAVSAGSLVVPMVMGLGVGFALPSAFIGADAEPLVFALFIAAALSISSLPVIAKILGEMGFMRRNFGQLTLAAGMTNDVIGWVMLGIVAGLAQAGGVKLDKLGITIGGLLVFFVVAFTVGQRIVDRGLRAMKRSDAPAPSRLGFVLVVAIALGAVTQALHVEAVLGAFVAGVLLARSRFRDDATMHHLEHLTAALFAPIFFATAGLRVDLGLLAEREVFLWALAVVAVASISKFVGSLIGARVVGLSGREGAALGVGLNARGALEIVIATVGLSLGVLNQASYTVVVLMAVATSMMAPPLLRRVLRGWEGSDDERARLEHEETLATNTVVTGERLLLPTRGEPTSIMAAQVLDLAWPDGVGVTLVTPEPTGDIDVDPRGLRAIEASFVEHDVDVLHGGDDLEASLLDESRLGYGAIGLGLGAVPQTGPVLPASIESVIAGATVPIVLVRRARALDRDLPWAYAAATVPVAGTDASRAAQEIACNISRHIGTRTTLTHVVTATERVSALVGGGDGVPDAQGEARATGQRLLEQALVFGERIGARTENVLVEDVSVPAGILAAAERDGSDLIVLGCKRRMAGDRVFLGHTAEGVLRAADSTVVVVVMPT